MRALAWNCDGTALGCGSENRAVTVGSMDPSSCRLVGADKANELNSLVLETNVYRLRTRGTGGSSQLQLTQPEHHGLVLR